MHTVVCTRGREWVLRCATIFALAWAAGCGGEGSRSIDTRAMVYGSQAASVSMESANAPDYFAGMGVSTAPEVKPAPNTPTQEIRIDVAHREVQVSDSVRFLAWTFGGLIPGPVVHVRQGVRVRFTMKNRSDETISLSAPMPHSMDFHSAMVNPNDKYQSIGPGATIQFEWVANYPGVFMYHCATPPVLQHLAAGMYGMVIVEPKNGYPTKVDREYALVQSEFYLGRSAKGEYTVDMTAAMQKRPTAVAFNGRVNQHVTRPLTAKPGERVRLYILNVGPNETSSFHVIGTILDRVWIDGAPINEMRGMQTVFLGASSGAIVEFVIPEAGVYTFVDHEFADSEMGAKGNISTLAPGAPLTH